MSDTLPARHARALGALGLLLAGAATAAVLYAVSPALPYNALQLPFAGEVSGLVVVPQRWAFFTRDPREERLTIYQRASGAWAPVMLGPHGRVTNALGLNRASRAQAAEAGALGADLPTDAWRACDDGVLLRCIVRATVAPHHRVNASPRPTLCGPIALVRQAPVPWAWQRLPTPVRMPARVLSLEVVCSAG